MGCLESEPRLVALVCQICFWYFPLVKWITALLIVAILIALFIRYGSWGIAVVPGWRKRKP